MAPTRKTRSIRQNNVIPFSTWGNSRGEGSVCVTARAEYGACVSFKTCYPYFKKKLPDISVWDTWILGHYDACTYYDTEGRQAFGVCCSNPVNLAADDSVSVNTVNNRYEISNWPPPVPTHPPNHSAPTHPSVSGSWPSGIVPFQTSTTTRRPVTYPWPPTHPSTHPTTTVQSDSTAYCGAKNGNQDQERIVGGQNAVPNEWPWIVALFNSGRQFCGGSLINTVHILTAAHCIAQ